MTEISGEFTNLNLGNL